MQSSLAITKFCGQISEIGPGLNFPGNVIGFATCLKEDSLAAVLARNAPRHARVPPRQLVQHRVSGALRGDLCEKYSLSNTLNSFVVSSFIPTLILW